MLEIVTNKMDPFDYIYHCVLLTGRLQFLQRNQECTNMSHHPIRQLRFWQRQYTSRFERILSGATISVL